MAAALSSATRYQPLSLQTIHITQTESCMTLTLFCYKCKPDVIVRVTASDTSSTNIKMAEFLGFTQNFISIQRIEVSSGKLEIAIKVKGSGGTVFLKSISILIGQCDTLGM